MYYRLLIFVSIFLFLTNTGYTQVTPIERAALQAIYNALDGPNWVSENDGDPSNDWDFTGLVTNNWHGVSLSGNNVIALTISRFAKENNHSGVLPPEIGDFPIIETLEIAYGNLNGVIPPQLANLTTLKNLNLGRNKLTGNIPDYFSTFPNIASIQLDDNALEGNIPDDLGAIKSNIFRIWLQRNSLTGTLPASIGTLTSLSQFYVYMNNLEGIIPPNYVNLVNMQWLILNNNNFRGDIPAFTSNPNIIWIGFGNNAFQFGDFEDEFSYYSTVPNVFKDGPQAKVNVVGNETRNVGETITFITEVSGSQNNYQWYKDNQLISGAINATYTISPVQSSDAGVYHCVITSDIVTDLTLQRNDITLNVNGTADTTPPAISCPISESLFVNTTLPNYYYKLKISDTCLEANDFIYTQLPLPGTPFIGNTNVTVSVTNGRGYTTSCSFEVTVRTPVSSIECSTPSIRTDELDGTNGFQVDGDTVRGTMGFDVRGAGDINGDGISDFILGAPGQNYYCSGGSSGGQSVNTLGAAYVIFGNETGFLPNFDTGLLNGSNGFKIENDTSFFSQPYTGYQVSSAGDINDDGFDDIMISDPFRKNALGAELGHTYFIYGKTSGFSALFKISAIDGSNGFVFAGIDGFDQSGLSISMAGDINNDGISDIIIGARAARPTNSAGKCYVVFGRSSGFPALVRGGDLNGSNGFIMTGDADGEGIGNGVAGLGDVNGDNIDDIGFEGGLKNRTYVVFGRSGAFPANIPTASINGSNGFYIDISSFSYSFKQRIKGIGDVNNDGIHDMLFGNKWLLFGKNTGFSNAENIASLDGTNGVELVGETNRVSSAGGDFNADGIQDFIVGSFGSVVIVYGKSSAWEATLNPFSLSASEGFVINRTINKEYAVSELGDINKDGITDIIIGDMDRLWTYNASPDSGHGYVIFGFSVVDTENPTITCPDNQLLASGNTLPDYTSLAIVTDNCDNQPVITQNPEAGSIYNPGMSITLIATDKKGNTANCIFVVNENTDTENPVVSCPTDQELPCNTTIPDYRGLVTATDNQDSTPVITQNPEVGTIFNDGMVVTITATDASGNAASCSFAVKEVLDKELPSITCPGDQVLTADSLLPDYMELLTVTDNCDSSPTLVQNPAPGSVFVSGMKVTMTATDNSGNSTMCSFLVNAEVSDTESPVVSCLTDQELPCNTTIPDYRGLVTATDNQDLSPIITQNPAEGTPFTDGMAITITATDASGNAASCMFKLWQATVSVTAGEDVEILQGQEIQLSAQATSPGVYYWSPATSLTDATLQSPTATPSETTTYSVLFTADNGCVTEDLITVYVRPLSNDETKYGFSPDGDGINEFWEIDTIEQYPNNIVSIYNRWGDLVFEVEGYDNSTKVFDGIANKKRKLGADKLPEGTYFFTINTASPNTLKKVTGFLVLKR